jgi:hypothetical protein
MTKTLTIFLFFLLSFPSGLSAAGSEGYTVKFRITGLHDTVCMVAYYYGNSTYVTDTLQVDRNGRCTFSSLDARPGLYLLVITERNYFEFVLNEDRKFSMETSASNPTDRMIITGSPENVVFYEYLKRSRSDYKEIDSLSRQLEKYKSNADSAAAINNRIAWINREMIGYKVDIAEKYPSSMLTVIIRAIRETDIPEAPLMENGKTDSSFAYRYFRAHYWDYVDLTDNRVLRTPVFHNKLQRYFDEVIPQLPDSIIPEIDKLVTMARPNPEMFKYLIWFFTYHYERSEIMGFDRIFVHIVDTYYKPGETPWLTETSRNNIMLKADRISPLLIGKQGPNMIMMDTSGQLVSLYGIEAGFLVILFWDPDCGHCEKEIGHLTETYRALKDSIGLKVFAVCSDTSLAKMKQKVIRYGMEWINVNGPRSVTKDYHDLYDIQTTPVIYILDREKKIIAKRLPADKVKIFLRNYGAIVPHP